MKIAVLLALSAIDPSIHLPTVKTAEPVGSPIVVTVTADSIRVGNDVVDRFVVIKNGIETHPLGPLGAPGLLRRLDGVKDVLIAADGETTFMGVKRAVWVAMTAADSPSVGLAVLSDKGLGELRIRTDQHSDEDAIQLHAVAESVMYMIVGADNMRTARKVELTKGIDSLPSTLADLQKACPRSRRMEIVVGSTLSYTDLIRTLAVCRAEGFDDIVLSGSPY